MSKYTVDHIPRNTPCNRRPGIAMVSTTITIHNTGNEKSSAANERAWLTNPSNDRQASFHIVIDERQAIECLPLNESAWHAGDGRGNGNMRSIGIEICESGDYGKTLQSAAELVAKMLHERNWDVDRLRRHFDWSGKICPRLMYSGGKWTAWDRFKLMVSRELDKLKGVDTDLEKVNVTVDGKKVLDGVLINGVSFIPARVVAESLGAKVDWDGKSKTVSIGK